MKQRALTTILKNLNACYEARKWAIGKTPTQAWKMCKHPEWMVWIIRKTEWHMDDRYLKVIEEISRAWDERQASPKERCDIIRAIFPKPPTKKDFKTFYMNYV